MAKWKKQVFRLDSKYDWKAKPGNKVFVADRGALRFDFPGDWYFSPDVDTEAALPTLKLYDRKPPDDNCLLEVTIFNLPPGIDWRQMPLPKLLSDTMPDDDDSVLSRSKVVYSKRGDLEIAWLETRFVDPGEKREARSRTCMARRGNIQPLMTFSFWPEDATRLEPVWDELLRSLRLGEYIAMPVQRGGN